MNAAEEAEVQLLQRQHHVIPVCRDRWCPWCLTHHRCTLRTWQHGIPTCWELVDASRESAVFCIFLSFSCLQMFHIECRRSTGATTRKGQRAAALVPSLAGRCKAAAHAGGPESHRFSNIESCFGLQHCGSHALTPIANTYSSAPVKVRQSVRLRTHYNHPYRIRSAIAVLDPPNAAKVPSEISLLTFALFQ